MATLGHLFPVALVVTVMIEAIIVFAIAPTVALVASLAIAVCDALQVDPSSFVSGFRVHLADVLCIALVGAVGARLVMRKAASLAPGVIMLGLIVVLALVRGVGQFGLQPAVNEARELLYFVTAFAYFSTVPSDTRSIWALRRAWLWAAALLVGVGVFRWAHTGLGILTGQGVTGRALTGSAAVIVLEAGVIALAFPVGRGFSRWIYPSVCLSAVILSVQRTVWIAACVGLAVLFISASRVGERKSSALIRMILVIVGSVFAFLLVAGPGALGTLGGASSLSQDGTFTWRFSGWQQLVGDQVSGPIGNLLIGNPAGHGFARIIDSQQVIVAAHSEYVTVFVSSGVLGLLFLVALLFSSVRATRRSVRLHQGMDRRTALLLLALVAIQIVYFVTYSSGVSAGILLGAATAFSRRTALEVPSVSAPVGVAGRSSGHEPGG